MRLKKLELLGFKSFANKTEVLFDQGVTCVVGPNGCGKSNISDSIRWVLGERSAKLLRGAKMEDVIFSGTDFRKPLAYAEVSLTFDNADRGLPIDYSEVTITRRLYRSGESEYLINKTLVRLKDVQDLILDTGVGSNAYSMIGQGRIDYILNADADERRFLIEEAAGISKYKVKKEEALRKLEKTEQNLLRINDIVQEVHRNIQYAERQAKKAEKFKEKHEELKTLEIRKAFYDLEHLESEKDAVTSDQSRQKAFLEESRQKTEALEARKIAEEAAYQSVRAKHAEVEAKRFGLINQKEKNEQQLQFNQEKRLNAATRSGEIQTERTQLAERLARTRAELAGKSQNFESFATDFGRIEKEMRDADLKLKGSEEALAQSKELLKQGKSAAFELAAELVRVKNEYHRFAAFIETSDRHKSKMDGNLARFGNERGQWERKKNEYQKEIASLLEKIRGAEGKFAAMSEESKRSQTAVDRLREEIRALEREKDEQSAKGNMLREMEPSPGRAESAGDEISEEIRCGMKRIREVMRVRPGYEKAVEAVLGVYLEAWIAAEPGALRGFWPYLLKETSKGFSVLFGAPGGGTSGAVVQDPVIECELLQVLEIDPAYQDALSSFFRGIYVARPSDGSDLEQLLLLAEHVQIVTQSGIVFSPGGRIVCRGSALTSESVFVRKGLLEAIGKRLGEIESVWTEKEARRIEEEERVRRCQEQSETLSGEIMDWKIQKESFESLLQGIEEHLSSANRETQLVMDDILELETQRQESKSKKDALEIQLRELSEKESHQRHWEVALMVEIQEKEDIRNRDLAEAAERKAKFRHLESERLLLEDAIKILNGTISQDERRTADLEEETRRITERLADLEASDRGLGEEQKVIEERIRETDMELGVTRAESQRVEAALAEIEKEIHVQSETGRKLQEDFHQFEMRSLDLGYKERAIHERMLQAYQVRLEDLDRANYPWEDRDPHAMEELVAQLKEKVQSMGTVNLLAIEEYEELKQRYDFLAAQKQDLENAREQLLEAIRKINRTTKTLFEETFRNVQNYFKEYFQTLFRGGEARLVLVDETNPLESGIDIIVRPPGKKLQHISLLSGGEKAMTAIALLFALFRIKPSPFCMLDEVDAPLDEANIDRFLTVLRTFLETTQFIIITHNRKTIAMGDSLYGVTMEEAGVSKIVSVKVRTEVEETVGTSEKPEAATVQESSVLT